MYFWWQLCLLCLYCFFVHILIWIYTFSNHQAKLSFTAPIHATVVKVPFLHPFVWSFVLHLLHCSNAMHLQEIFTSSMAYLHVPHLIPLVSYGLLASLSSHDAMNLKLSMDFSRIFLRTSLPSVLVTPVSLIFILVLKLICFSLFSATCPISALLKFFPSSIIKK